MGMKSEFSGATGARAGAKATVDAETGGGSFGRGRRWLGPYSPLRGCSGVAALAATKIPRRGTPFNFKTGSQHRAGGWQSFESRFAIANWLGHSRASTFSRRRAERRNDLGKADDFLHARTEILDA